MRRRISVRAPALRVEKIMVEVPAVKFFPRSPVIAPVVVATPLMSCALKESLEAVLVAEFWLDRKRVSTVPAPLLTTSNFVPGVVVPMPTK